jgi:heme/copper-type cytochrome/quinol oxidase subunit 2
LIEGGEYDVRKKKEKDHHEMEFWIIAIPAIVVAVIEVARFIMDYVILK